MIAVSVIKYQYFMYINSILTAALWIRYSYHPHCQMRKRRHEWALVKGLTGTDLVVDQALNDHQSRK